VKLVYIRHFTAGGQKDIKRI